MQLPITKRRQRYANSSTTRCVCNPMHMQRSSLLRRTYPKIYKIQSWTVNYCLDLMNRMRRMLMAIASTKKKRIAVASKAVPIQNLLFPFLFFPFFLPGPYLGAPSCSSGSCWRSKYGRSVDEWFPSRRAYAVSRESNIPVTTNTERKRWRSYNMCFWITTRGKETQASEEQTEDVS